MDKVAGKLVAGGWESIKAIVLDWAQYRPRYKLSNIR
jgi:hypothetical protein